MKSMQTTLLAALFGLSLFPFEAVYAAPQTAEVQRFIAMTRRPLAYPQAPERDLPRTEISGGGFLVKPCASPRDAPVVLLVHGGLPDAATIPPSVWRVYQDWANVLAGRGVAAVMYDHGLGSPDRRLDRAVGETDRVLEWLARNGATHGLDVDRVFLLTFSAGALLVPELTRPGRPLPVRRVGMLYPMTGRGPSDRSPEETVARMDLGRAASEFRDGPPAMIIRAGGDEVPNLLPLLDERIQALLAEDAPISLINLPGAAHGFDLETGTPRSNAAIEAMIAFVGGAGAPMACAP